MKLMLQELPLLVAMLLEQYWGALYCALAHPPALSCKHAMTLIGLVSVDSSRACQHGELPSCEAYGQGSNLKSGLTHLPQCCQCGCNSWLANLDLGQKGPVTQNAGHGSAACQASV